MTTTVITPRSDAVRRIAARIAARDDYIVTVPPAVALLAIDALTDIPRWTAYLDGGLPTILRTTDRSVLHLAYTLGGRGTIVVVVPKAVPARILAEAFGKPIAADGSQDLLVLGEPEPAPVMWPVLFVDALAEVAPAAAAEIRSTALELVG